MDSEKENNVDPDHSVVTIELNRKESTALLRLVQHVSRDIEDDLALSMEEGGVSYSSSIFLSEGHSLIRGLVNKLIDANNYCEEKDK
tara:strand:- start:73 stop:333 length:261 start_codon:yes stop_codon:yes gene_type:complete